MGKNTSTLTVRILGNAKNLVAETGRAGVAIGGLAKAGLAAGAGLAAIGIGAGVGLFKIGDQFDQMSATIAKGSGASGDALAALMAEAKDVMATVPESSAIVGSALADVNTFFGQTGDVLEKSTKGFLDFARVHEVDLNKAISGSDAILTQFGESAGNLDEVLGDLTRISQATGAPMDKLLGQMETFGPVFANANFTIEETAAIFGQLEQAGVDMSRVGPAINKFFRDSAAAGKEPKVAMAAMVEKIGDATTSSEALNLATKAFGSEGAQRMVSAIRSGNFDLADFNGLLGDGTGIVAEQAKATATFGEKWSVIKNKVLVGLEPLATKVFDGISAAMDKLGPYIDEFGVWFGENLPGWIATAQGLFDVWGPRVVAVFEAVVGWIKANWPSIKSTVLDVFEAVSSWVEKNWPQIQAVIVSVFEAVTAWINDNWPAIQETILAVFEAVTSWLEENWPTIESVITQVLEAVAAVVEVFVVLVTTLWGQFGDDILRLVEIVWSKLGPIIQGAVDIITGVVSAFKALFTGDWQGLWDSIGQIFSGAWEIAKALITGAFDILATLIGATLETLGAVISEAWDGIVEGVTGLGTRVTDAASGVFDGIKDAFKSAINFIIDGWNGLEFSIPGFSVGGIGFDGFTLGVPDVPRLATGGAVFSPKLVVVGDNPGAYSDPEIVAPRSMMVDAFREALQDAHLGGGGVNIEQVNVTERPILEELAELRLLAAA